MPISTQWDDAAQTIYRVNLDALDWTWAEFTEVIRNSYDLIQSTERTVHLILWFKGSRLPTGNVLAHMRVAGSTQPKNLRHTVLINESGSFLERIIETVDRTRGWEGPAILDSLAAARDYLAEKVQADERAN